MVRVIFVNMPIRTNEPAKHVPVGLAQLASILNEYGYEVAILDANAYRMSREVLRQELKAEADEKKFDFIGLSGMITTYKVQKEWIPAIKKDHPDSLLISGGGCASTLPEKMLKWNPSLDMTVVGEAEKTVLDIIKHLSDKAWSEVKGIAYRVKPGKKKIVHTEPQPLMTDKEYDMLPYPFWELLPLEDPERPQLSYFFNSPLPLSKESLFCKRRLSMETSRGCPYTCTYCTDIYSGQNRTDCKGPKIRFHSAKYVVDMIKDARFRYAIDFVSLVDECFTVNKKRVFEICDLLIKEDLPKYVSWGTTAHARTVEPNMLRNLKDAGCTYLDFGFESNDNRILKDIRKSSNSGLNQRAFNMCIDARVTPITNFMIGYPNENYESVMATADFLVRNNVRCKPFFITPFPKTKLFEQHKQRILEDYDGSLEKYILDLGETTELHTNLTVFNDPELIGLQQLIHNHDLKRLKKWRTGGPL